MKKFALLFCTFFLIFSSFLYVPKTSSDELGDITKQIQDLTTSLNASLKATAPLESQLNSLKKQVDGIKNRLSFIENDITVKEKNIDKGYKNLAKQELILNRAIRDFYIKSYYNSPIWIFFSSSSVTDITQILAYQKAATNQNKAIITNIALTTQDLEAKKKNLENEKRQLSSLQSSLGEQSAKLDEIVSGAKKYQAGLSSKIAQLNAQQQQIIGQRLSDLGIPRSAGSSSLYCTDDRKIDPGFSGFAFFTYGIPHYVGMNQYGAYGRAKANQDYKTILNAYFQNISIECRDMPSEIDVEGFGRKPFEEYIKGVVNKEMGADLSEALKAQAIAARSFALVETNNATRSICATQSCQVYSDARRDAVNSAVDATGVNACGAGKAEAVVSGGSIAKTWYASTFGGYAHTSAEIWGGSTSYTKNFADTKAPVSSFDDLKANAYDNESACFYTAQGWRRGEYKNSAWLKPEEVADIANVILLVRKDSSKKCFVYQPDKSPPPPDPNKGCPTTDNWSSDRVRQELGGEAISTATSVEVTGIDWNSGKTTQIKINGIDFDGNEFKNYFNLRAPANIQIVGPLYNIERK